VLTASAANASDSVQTTLSFVGTNPENAANFCIARRSGGISAIVSGRLPRSRLLARVRGTTPTWSPLFPNRITSG